MYSILGLLLGAALGMFLPVSIPGNYSVYVLLVLIILVTRFIALARVKKEERPKGMQTFLSVSLDALAVILILLLGSRLGVATEQPLLIVLLLRLMGQISGLGAVILKTAQGYVSVIRHRNP